MNFQQKIPWGSKVKEVVPTKNNIKEITAGDLDAGDYIITTEDRNMYLVFTVAVNNVIFDSTSAIVKGAEYQGRFAASEASIVGNDNIKLEYPATLTATYSQNGVFLIKSESTTVLALSGHQKTSSLLISPKSQSLNSGGGSFNLDITTDQSWTITDNSGGWLSYSVTSGTGNITVTVTYTANPTPEIGRFATITVNDGNNSKTSSVSQNPV